MFDVSAIIWLGERCANIIRALLDKCILLRVDTGTGVVDLSGGKSQWQSDDIEVKIDENKDWIEQTHSLSLPKL